MLIDASPKCELDQAACALLFHETEPEMFNKSEQNHSDKARKTGKLLRHGEKIRQIVQTWREIQAHIKHINRLSREGRAKCASFAHTAPNKKRTWRKSRSVALTSSKNAPSHRAHRIDARAQRMPKVSSKPYRRNQTRG